MNQNHRDCGWHMNHYCSGLLYLMRSEYSTVPRNYQIQWLATAKESTEYTLKGMQAYPYCPLRSHVEATLMKVNARLAVKK